MHTTSRTWTTAALSVAAVLTLALSAHADDGAAVPLDIRRTGDRPDVAALQQPEVAWRFTPKSEAASAPVAYDGVVYFGDHAGTLHALQSKTGTPIWTHAHHKSIEFAPWVVEDLVLFGSEAALAALDRKTGALRWSLAIKHGVSRPLVAGNRVFAGCYDGTVVSLDVKSGAGRWIEDCLQNDPPRFRFGQVGKEGRLARPTECASDGTTFFQTFFDQSRIVAIDCATGATRWSFQAKGAIKGDPTITDRLALFASQDQHVYCLDKQTGVLAWTFDTGARADSGPSVRGNGVYVSAYDGRLHRLDLATGQKVWSFQTPAGENGKSAIYSSPLLLKDALCFATGEGRLYALDLETGQLKWKVGAGDSCEIYSSPVTDGQRLFVTLRTNSDDGWISHIVAFDENSGR